MKDYITIASNIGLEVPLSWEFDWIRHYKLNRSNHKLTISYWNYYVKDNETKECPPEKEKEMIAKLDDTQREQFSKMYEDITKKYRSKLKWNMMPISTFYLANGILQICTGNFLGASVWATGLLMYAVPFSITPKELKLVREMKLVKWIIENRDAVDALIRREVDEARDVDLSHMDPVVRYDIYPTERTPYPEEMYNEGINLNNIASLDNKTLQGIKKKILQKEKKHK